MFSVTSKAAFTLPGDNRTIKPDIAKSGRLACDRCRNMQKPEPCGISRLRALPAPRVKPAGLVRVICPIPSCNLREPPSLDRIVLANVRAGSLS